jgi:hypothetical protein
MNTLAHERCDGCIDQPVTLELRQALEGVRYQYDPEVPTLARAGVTRVLGTVVNDFQ